LKNVLVSNPLISGYVAVRISRSARTQTVMRLLNTRRSQRKFLTSAPHSDLDKVPCQILN